MSHPPDDPLLNQLAQGDEQALITLYDSYAHRVYTLALRILNNVQSAEEITQDVFLRLWKHSHTYQSARGSFSTWLLTITRNAALDRLRSEQRRPPLDEHDVDERWEQIVDTHSQTDEARWRELYFAVQALPIEQRRVIELAYYHGMSHSQMAEELHLPLGTIKTRLRLGMEQLRRDWFKDEKSKTDATNV